MRKQSRGVADKDMDSAVLLLVIASLYSSVHSQLCTVPNGKPKCVCETAQGTIDLTSVAEKTYVTDNWRGVFLKFHHHFVDFPQITQSIHIS